MAGSVLCRTKLLTCFLNLRFRLKRRYSLNNKDIPIWEKYLLTIEEAAQYFHIGENKLRRLVSENPDDDYIIYNGSRVLIKRSMFERYIDMCNTI